MIALLALLACDGYGLVVLGSAGVSTVGNASWTAPAESRTRLVAEDAEGVRVRGEWQGAGAGVVSMAVLGLRPSTEYAIHVEAESGSPGEAISFTTGPLPSAFPSWSTTGAPGWTGFLVTSLIGESQWAVVLDEAGTPVWYVEVPDEGNLVRVRERKDGRGVWAVPAARVDKSDSSFLIGLDWNGVELERHEIAEFSHDYLELETGTIAFLNYDRRVVDGVQVIGNTITELDLESGAELDVFSTFDLWDPALDALPGDGEWTGGNAMDFDAETGVYTAGFRQMGALVEVERASGAVLRQFGGPSSDVEFPAEADEFRLQHQFQLSENAALVFDNRESGEDSRVIEYTLEGNVATPVWTHISEPPVWVFALGDVDRADDGSTFIDWASAGALEDVDAEGQTRWTLSAELGTAFGFLDRVNGFGGFERP